MSVLCQIFNSTQGFLILTNFILRRFWVVKISFWARFWTRLKISVFCQFSSFTGLEWTKFAILIQILTGTKNYSILPNFILHMYWVVKNVSFELNFRHKSKFLDFAKFHSSQVRIGQTLHFKPNFQHDWKFLDFAKFHPSQVQSG